MKNTFPLGAAVAVAAAVSVEISGSRFAGAMGFLYGRGIRAEDGLDYLARLEEAPSEDYGFPAGATLKVVRLEQAHPGTGEVKVHRQPLSAWETLFTEDDASARDQPALFDSLQDPAPQATISGVLGEPFPLSLEAVKGLIRLQGISGKACMDIETEDAKRAVDLGMEWFSGLTQEEVEFILDASDEAKEADGFEEKKEDPGAS
jgi:hypothetical protein